jgi:hypothetical protein
MATLAAPTLEGVTEAVGVGSTAQKKFKQYLAKFVSDDVEIEDDEASRSDSESEQELESPDRDEPSEQNLAKNTPTGTKRKATSDIEERKEQKLLALARPWRQKTAQRFDLPDRAARIAASKLGRRRKTLAQRSRPPQKETIAWRDFARDFKLSKRTGDPRKAPLPSSRDLQKKQKHVKRQLAFHRTGTGVIIKRPFRNVVLDKIAKLEKAASMKKAKQSKSAKELGGAKNGRLLLSESVRETEEYDDETAEMIYREFILSLSTEDGAQEQSDETGGEDKAVGGDDPDNEYDPDDEDGPKDEDGPDNGDGPDDGDETDDRDGTDVEDDSDDEDDPNDEDDQDDEDETNDEETESIGDGDDPKKGRKRVKLDFTVPYIDQLRQLSKELPTQKQITALEDSASMGPRFLGRTVSDGRGDRYAPNMTNGFTAQDLFLPSADTWEEFRSHARLADLKQGEIILMSGQHLAWADCRHDEFLSYSKDLLFLLVHALNRFHNGQKGVTIQYINCDEATSPDGQPAAFYNALDVYGAFEIDAWPGWSRYNHEGLHPREFTHEYLTHGIIKHNDSTLKQARLVDLIRDGLFELMPSLYVPYNHRRMGLYTAQVVYRKIGYPGGSMYSYDSCRRSVSLTTDTLNLVRKITLNFFKIPTGADVATLEPPLHIFLQFLTLLKRDKSDPVLMAWIKEHYDGKSTPFHHLPTLKVPNKSRS